MTQDFLINISNPTIHFFEENTLFLTYSNEPGTLATLSLKNYEEKILLSGHSSQIYKYLITSNEKYLITIGYD